MKAVISLCMLASGSKGNAIYISDGNTSLLIDAGLSGKEIERRLAAAGVCPTSLDAILVTHEHSDHVKGVGVLSRRYQLPVYITAATLDAAPQIGKLHEIRWIQCGTTFSVNGFDIHPFSCPMTPPTPWALRFSRTILKSVSPRIWASPPEW